MNEKSIEHHAEDAQARCMESRHVQDVPTGKTE